MQIRDYDDRIYVSAIKEFRQVNNMHNGIDINQETNGYCNVYVDSIAVSYLHSMKEPQINAIHYFEDNFEVIFNTLLDYLSERFKDIKKELGFSSINILDENKENMCFTEYTFINVEENKVKLRMFKDKVI